MHKGRVYATLWLQGNVRCGFYGIHHTVLSVREQSPFAEPPECMHLFQGLLESKQDRNNKLPSTAASQEQLET